MLFKVLNTFIKFCLIILFLLVAPVIYLISLAFAGSFNEAWKETVETLYTPFRTK